MCVCARARACIYVCICVYMCVYVRVHQYVCVCVTWPLSISTVSLTARANGSSVSSPLSNIPTPAAPARGRWSRQEGVGGQ